MKIVNQNFDEERALYGLHDSEVISCNFQGPQDGESPFKETHDILVDSCYFALRYPFWHVNHAKIINTEMTDLCRAALWYDNDVTIENSKLHGIKAVRECHNASLNNCDIISPEFGWMSANLKLSNCKLTGEYPFLHSNDIELDHFELSGKYSFQYVENMVIKNSYLDTKDAFWHSKNVTVYDSVLKGEYLAWYSENLKLVRCKIIGTQPLCYAKGLILEDCEMIDTDLSFEKSDVQATIKGNIVSVKNPESGYICADSIDQIVLDAPTKCQIRCCNVMNFNQECKECTITN